MSVELEPGDLERDLQADFGLVRRARDGDSHTRVLGMAMVAFDAWPIAIRRALYAEAEVASLRQALDEADLAADAEDGDEDAQAELEKIFSKRWPAPGAPT